MNEIWKTIIGCEPFEVSNLGRIRSQRVKFLRRNGSPYKYRDTLRKLSITKGYYCITLDAIKTRRREFVHRLVAEAFLPNPEGREQVNHKNLDRLDNRVENLEWTTRQENIDHAVAQGRYAKISPEVIVSIHKAYHSGHKSMVNLVAEHGLTIRTVSNIITGRRHSHLTKDLPRRTEATPNTQDFSVEEYRPIPSRPSWQISSHGSIRDSNGNAVYCYDNGNGYVKCCLGYIHRLVASVFLPNPDEHKSVHHIDNDKANNHASNLQWCSQSHNTRKACQDGLTKRYHGASNKMSKLTPEQVIEIRRLHNEENVTSRQISKRLGIPGTTVHEILNDNTWTQGPNDAIQAIIA